MPHNLTQQIALALIGLRGRLADWIERHSTADAENGSHTTDVLLWALAIVVVVGLAVAFLTGYVNKIGAELLAS